MVRWIREGWSEARREPLKAVLALTVLVSVVLSAVSSIGSYQNSIEIRHVSHDSIQRQCEMAFANGKAIIKTASRNERPSPETIEAYRKNIEDGANEVLRKYDIKFNCVIPSIAEDEANGKDEKNKEAEEEG